MVNVVLARSLLCPATVSPLLACSLEPSPLSPARPWTRLSTSGRQRVYTQGVGFLYNKDPSVCLLQSLTVSLGTHAR